VAYLSFYLVILKKATRRKIWELKAFEKLGVMKESSENYDQRFFYAVFDQSKTAKFIL